MFFSLNQMCFDKPTFFVSNGGHFLPPLGSITSEDGDVTSHLYSS